MPESFQVIEEIINESQEEQLIRLINNLEWNKDISRWTQHYGYEYIYSSRTIKKIDGEIPDFLLKIKDRIYKDADQFLINRYLPGEGIALHQDLLLFEDKVFSLSLGSGCTFQIDGQEIYLKRRSLLKMNKRVYHGISKRKFDTVDGKRVPRDLRISITFRKVRKNDNQ